MFIPLSLLYHLNFSVAAKSDYRNHGQISCKLLVSGKIWNVVYDVLKVTTCLHVYYIKDIILKLVRCK
jgi:hypothetical protein